jgi:hypothetical protein
MLKINSSKCTYVVNPTADFFEPTQVRGKNGWKEVTAAQKAMDFARDKFGDDVQTVNLYNGNKLVMMYDKKLEKPNTHPGARHHVKKVVK